MSKALAIFTVSSAVQVMLRNKVMDAAAIQEWAKGMPEHSLNALKATLLAHEIRRLSTHDKNRKALEYEYLKMREALDPLTKNLPGPAYHGCSVLVDMDSKEHVVYLSCDYRSTCSCVLCTPNQHTDLISLTENRKEFKDWHHKDLKIGDSFIPGRHYGRYGRTGANWTDEGVPHQKMDDLIGKVVKIVTDNEYGDSQSFKCFGVDYGSHDTFRRRYWRRIHTRPAGWEPKPASYFQVGDEVIPTDILRDKHDIFLPHKLVTPQALKLLGEPCVIENIDLDQGTVTLSRKGLLTPHWSHFTAEGLILRKSAVVKAEPIVYTTERIAPPSLTRFSTPGSRVHFTDKQFKSHPGILEYRKYYGTNYRRDDITLEKYIGGIARIKVDDGKRSFHIPESCVYPTDVRHNVGDRVRVRAHAGVDEDGNSSFDFNSTMKTFVGKTATITDVGFIHKGIPRYNLDIDDGRWQWHGYALTPIKKREDCSINLDWTKIRAGTKVQLDFYAGPHAELRKKHGKHAKLVETFHDATTGKLMARISFPNDSLGECDVHHLQPETGNFTVGDTVFVGKHAPNHEGGPPRFWSDGMNAVVGKVTKISKIINTWYEFPEYYLEDDPGHYAWRGYALTLCETTPEEKKVVANLEWRHRLIESMAQLGVDVSRARLFNNQNVDESKEAVSGVVFCPTSSWSHYTALFLDSKGQVRTCFSTTGSRLFNSASPI